MPDPRSSAPGAEQIRGDGTRYYIAGSRVCESRAGRVSLLSADLKRPLAVWLSRDERNLFALDAPSGKLWRYDLDLMLPGELVATVGA